MESKRSNDLPVVILNMHYTGLGIARDLADLPCQVHGCSFDPGFPGNFSKHCSYVACPDTATEPDEAERFLLEFARHLGQQPLLLPTRDHDVHFIMSRRERLQAHYLIPFPSNDVWGAVQDKSSLSAAAARAGVACPVTTVIRARADLDEFAADFDWPVIVKPLYARDWRQAEVWDAVGRRKAVVVDGLQELRGFYEGIADAAPEMLVQTYVPGKEQNLLIFGSFRSARSGDIRYFTARKILQYPPGSGTGVVVQHEIIPEIVEPSLSLLDTLGYSGISEIEYKYDPETKRYWLIEINARHWDQHSLGASVGVNLSAALFAEATGLALPKGEQSSRPVRWIADDGLLVILAGQLRGKSGSWALLRAVLRGPRQWAVFKLDDVGPSWKLLKNILRDMLTAFRGRFP